MRTVYLNMQEYVYDGINRDRVVWIGDMHPETSAISRLFGDVEAVRKSLDFVRDHTAHGRWMNDIPSYTCWWIKIHRDWYWYGGDKAYLAEQTSYLKEVLPALFAAVNQDGSVNIDFKFIDWPSSDNSQAQDAGLKALLRIAFLSAKEILEICDEKDGELIKMCDVKATELLQGKAEANGNKQAAALMVLAGLATAPAASSAMSAMTNISHKTARFSLLLPSVAVTDFEKSADSFVVSCSFICIILRRAYRRATRI